ncbi:MAG: ATP-binding cassette domain-containing protein [Bacilli bacterium]|nr:ATP-binding cassette domain-containing protein [Bacilli bacterium]
MEKIVETFSLTKKYGDKVVLDNVDLTVKKGSIVGLVGKNGAGKTTLIRCLTDVISLTSGSYSLFGVPSTDAAGIRKTRSRIAAMIESPALYMGASARVNLLSQAILFGVEGDLEEFVNEQLRFVGLEEVIGSKKRVKDFSLGMRQRMGIAMSLVGNPELLLLDEPTNGLDPEGIVEIRNLLLKLNKEKGTTILISSHILGELSKLAHSYIFLDKGKIIKQIDDLDLEFKEKNKLVITVNEPKKLVDLLSNENIHYETDEEAKDTFHIYGVAEVGPFITNVVKKGIDILSLKEIDNNLEDIYLDLLSEEGSNNA